MNLMTPTCTFGIWHVKYNKYDYDYDGLMATGTSTCSGRNGTEGNGTERDPNGTEDGDTSKAKTDKQAKNNKNG
ncbi:hypothetical protein ACLKA7_003007 [Drosophila subpalustris]